MNKNEQNLSLFLRNYLDNFGAVFSPENLRILIKEEQAVEGWKFLRSVTEGIRLQQTKNTLDILKEFHDSDLFAISAIIENHLKKLFEKVIFLDIDGVLAVHQDDESDISFFLKGTTYPFTPECVMVLNEILRLTNAEIVLTSSWRLFFNREEIQRIFEENGVFKSPIDFTSIIPEDDRNREVELFIQKYKIQKFLILDDINYGFAKDFFIRTNGKKGLNDEHISRAVSTLSFTYAG